MSVEPVVDEARGAVEAAYRQLAPIYDLVYGLGLQQGRKRAMARLELRPNDRVLEVGVGTGLSAVWYPASCQVAAIDLSMPMLTRARQRLARRGIRHVRLSRMDAGRLAFADNSFDAVYAPYTINVVPDPVGVAAEMLRVCRRGGRIVLLNHFAQTSTTRRPANRLVSRLAARTGSVDWNLELEPFLEATGLRAETVEAVNLRLSTLVVCRKP